jgi:hypothetical protein
MEPMKASRDTSQVASSGPLRTPQGRDDGGAVLGRLDGVDDEGRALFRPDGEKDARPVAIGMQIEDSALVKAAWLGTRALALRSGEGGRLVLISFIRERVASTARDQGPGELSMRVDGDTVTVRAQRTLELVCGKARVILHADGRIDVNGTKILQRSRGPIKLKGATIDLN